MKKPLLNYLFLAVFWLSVIIIWNGCSKSSNNGTPATLPVLTTDGLISNLTSTSAQSGGIITYNGGADILASGVCYSPSNQTPTTANAKTTDKFTIDDANTESFTSNLTGLIASTTYYLRAYATNSAGTAYGSTLKFTTSSNLTSISATVSTFAGSIAGGYLDGSGTGALFSSPQGVAADAQGNVYVADGFNNRIREITPGGVVSTFAGDGNPGYANGAAATAEFYGPQAIAIDGQGNIYVADIGNNVIRKITSSGIVSTFAGNGTRGYVNGASTAAEFNNPQSVAVDAGGHVYVADRSNNVIRKITSAGNVSTLAGIIPANYTTDLQDGIATVGYLDGAGSTALFHSPEGVAVDAGGNVYVADLLNYAIRKITPAGVVSTLAGGPVQTTLVGSPAGLAFDKNDNLYVTDQSGRILEITTDKVLYTLAGSYNTAGYVDGTGAGTEFNSPQGITVNGNGNIYVADFNNNLIRKITVAIQQ